MPGESQGSCPGLLTSFRQDTLGHTGGNPGGSRFWPHFPGTGRPAPPLPLSPGMSPISRALHEKFEEVCRAELLRLRRKTASLSPEQRAEVDAMTVEVTQAIAARVEAALERQPGDGLADIVARLFAVAPGTAPARVGPR